MTRKIARIVKLDDVMTHTNADSLDLAIVGGWQVVVKRGEYKPGDLAIFVEIDGFVPETIAPFLTKNYPREYNGVLGNRLRTIKLRGELSQGLILPMQTLNDVTGNSVSIYEVDEDVSEILNIQKWEMPEQMVNGQPRGNFPDWIQKTDQERIQNLSGKIHQWNEKELQWIAQEKLEGSSMTVYVRGEESGVCSKNIDLKYDENNTFWKTAIKYNVIEKIRQIYSDKDEVAIQGELIGPGIQGNIYNLNEHEFHVFDMQVNGYFLSESIVECMCEEMGLYVVPYLGKISFNNAKDCLDYAEGKSVLNPKVEREGVVVRCRSIPTLTFKAISNKYLLKEKEEACSI